MRNDEWERPAGNDANADRRARILDAAERCFVRSGFHRTTMQDVAAEAGMSAGNLYRYFRSKDAIVAGLAERDRAQMASDLSVIGPGDDFIAAFRELGRKHFEEEPRERAILGLEIWAEATRNREVAATVQEFEGDLIGHLTDMIAAAQQNGSVSRLNEARDIAVLIATLADGLFVRRATLPDFDAGREVGHVLSIIGALLKGHITLSQGVSDAGASS
ncbi:MAG: TetR/AcrR family transcriptional regulator [Pseudomonadota bacterium]|nr:MAG: TetR/AcrR family transcriptional regulator [Pseudomonadota bacterium]